MRIDVAGSVRSPRSQMKDRSACLEGASMRGGHLLVIALAAGLLVPSVALAGYDKAAWKADGEKFAAGDKTALKNAIDKFKDLKIKTDALGDTDLGKCGKCLKDMVDNDRICEETGDLKKTSSASVNGDDKAECGSKSDAMNVSKPFPSTEQLAAVLAHEWCHTAQASPVGTGVFEIPCYEVEVAVLEKLKGKAAEADKKKIQNRIDQMTKCIAEFKKAAAVVPPKTPADGGVIHEASSGASYGVFVEEATAGVLNLGNATTDLFAQPIVTNRPLNMIVEADLVSGVSDLVMISGLVNSDADGLIEALHVDDSLNVTPGFQLSLPGRHPFGMAFNRTTGRLYILDTYASEILTYSISPPYNSTPTFVGVFANLSGVPQLFDTLSIELLGGGNGHDLLAVAQDLRGVDRSIDPLTETLALLDSDMNGVMDGSAVIGAILDDLRFVPGYPDLVLAGDTTLRVFASAGATIEVHQVDPSDNSSLELLGTGTVGSTSLYVTVSLSRALNAGEFILAIDTTNGLDPDAEPLQVSLCNRALTPSSCRLAGKSQLTLKDQPGQLKDKLGWKWLMGAQTLLADFGSPNVDTEYELCVYAGTTATLVSAVAPDSTLWVPATGGFKYKDKEALSGGIKKVALKSGDAGKAKILFKGKGESLPDKGPGPLTLPVTVQLFNSANTICWEGGYATADDNDGVKFKASAP